MRNKKNIKRKKKLNTPKPSVFAVMGETEEGGGWKMCPSPPHTLSRALSLSATGQSSFIFRPPHSETLPLPRTSCLPLADTAVRHGTQAGCMAGSCCTEIPRVELETPLAGRESAKHNSEHTYSLTHSLARSPPTEGGRGEEGRQTDRQRVGER